MSKDIETIIFFYIGKQEYKAEQQFPTATWHISEACFEEAAYPNSGMHKTYRHVIEITCKSRNKEKIKAAFLALDECTDD